MKAGTEVYDVTVTWVERREEGWYFGYIPDDLAHGQWGCEMLRDEPGQWGLQSVEVLGVTVPVIPPPPPCLKGHPSYDPLM